MFKLRQLTFIGFICITLWGCNKANMELLASQPQYSELIQHIDNNVFHNLHSLIIYKDGKTQVELYRQGTWRGQPIPVGVDEYHGIASVSKSIVATLIFIAIEEGKINHIDEKMMNYFPEHVAHDKNDIRIRDLLNMTSGFIYDEWTSSYLDANNDAFIFDSTNDPLAFLLNSETTNRPGSKFKYTGANTHLLAYILETIYQQDLIAIADEKLFKPLNISHYKWWRSAKNNMVFAAGGLMLTSRGMLKIGQLYLNNGHWQGKRLFSADWSQQLSQPVSATNEFIKADYGLHFWQPKVANNTFAAVGFGGQVIFISPRDNAVIVLTAGNATRDNSLAIAQRIARNWSQGKHGW